MSNIRDKKLFSVKEITLIAMFTSIIAVCSWISIPMPMPFVPFTMQTFAIFLTIALLGMKNGTVSVILYILLGVMGVPVFAGFKSGISALMGQTGGYIMGFVLTAVVAGLIIGRFGNKIPVMAIAMVLGSVVCYAFGTAWFMVVYANANGPIGLMTALSWCVFPFIVPDLVKISLAILVTKRIEKYVRLH